MHWLRQQSVFIIRILIHETPQATVYLIPSFLDEEGMDALPAYILEAVQETEVFFVENERSARRYLKKIWKEMDIDSYPLVCDS